MKILYICSLFHPHQGGIETMVSELSGLLKENGDEAVILTKQFPRELPAHEKIKGVEIVRFPIPHNKNDYQALGEFLQQNDKKLKSDLIHIVGSRHPLPLIGWYLAKKWKIEMIATICGGEIPLPQDRESTRVWKKGQYTVRPFLNLINHLTTCSGFLKKQLIKNCPSLLKKPQVLLVGIKLSDYLKMPAQKNNRPYVLSLRRLVPSKGIDILLKSYIAMADKLVGIDLVIAGSGSEEQKLKKMAKKAKLSNRVKFIGDIPLADAIGYLKSAFCTVVPSRSEGGGLVNTEAIALGCPVIATDVGGIREYVGPGGLLVEKDSVTQLSRALLILYNKPAKRIALIKKGKKFSAKFEWPVLFPKYYALYQATIKNSRSFDYQQKEKKLPAKSKLLISWLSS
ncbi:MAG: glycosyltransferase family 4 protein [Candidatus Paceibacterota bacterium]|jgi:glycosyltransferase involved in cell wall biosynthesis